MTAKEMNKMEKKKIKELSNLVVVDDTVGVNAIHAWCPESMEFNRFLIKVEHHKITVLWGFYGKIAFEDKTAYRLI